MESPRSGIPSVKATRGDSSPTTPAAVLLLRASSNNRKSPAPLHFPSPCHLYPVPGHPPCFCLLIFPPELEFNTSQRQLQVYYHQDGVCVTLLASQPRHVAAVGQEKTPFCCCCSFGTQMRRNGGHPILLLPAFMGLTCTDMVIPWLFHFNVHVKTARTD